MHSLELTRIATVIAAAGESLAVAGTGFPVTAMTSYWVANRQRFELWNRGLTRFSELENVGRSLAMRDWWLRHLKMIEEILISEILTRVMAAVGAIVDAKIAAHDVEPLTQSVFTRHLEARNQVLRLLLFGRGSSVDETLRLNRLRRCAERWTDFLIGPLTPRHPETLPFVIDPERVRAITRGFEHQASAREPAGVLPVTLTWLGIRGSLGSLSRSVPAMPHANRSVGEAALACLGPRLFDSLGLPRSTIAQRIAEADSPECQPAGEQLPGHPLFRPDPLPVPSALVVRWTN